MNIGQKNNFCYIWSQDGHILDHEMMLHNLVDIMLGSGYYQVQT